MKKVKQKPYIIGLDLGTNSVGWSVMYNNYKVPSRTMPVLGNTSKETITKNMMGVVLFDSGNDASQRRLSRGASRRYDRKRRRVFYLQDIFKDVMEEVDENFFQRLDESFLTPEDKTHEKYTIFGTSAEEKAYQKRFPTIYHLREYVANTNEKVDIRLVYLVLAHMIKNRGHFLIDDPNFQVTNNDPLSLLNEMIEEYNEVEDESISLAPTEVSDVLKATLKKTDKTEKVLSYLPDVKKKNLLEALISLAVGRLVNFKTVFKLEEDASLQVSKETFETDLNALISLIGEEYEEVFLLAKKVNSSILLADVLSEGDTKSPLSTKMVQRYDKHKEDLALLKKVVKEVAPESYNDVFRKDEKDGYASYIGLNKKHRKRKTAAASEQAFYTYIKKLLKDDPRAKEVLNEIEKEDFLRKQRTFDNGSIPYQVHLAEMKAVLASQGQYYPFLKENADKIQQILSFRIPYYVGPLAKGYSDYAWVERNSDEAIRPWNFDQVVNKEKSAEKFIEQLTSYDLNLPNEKVLPKNSILYQTFGVFNELTKIQFVAEGMTNYAFLTGAQKKDIFERFFKQNKGGKVTKKDLIKYLENNHGYRVLEIKGIESQFNAKFSTYHDLNQIIQDKAYLDNEDNQEILERIVHALTVFNDREMVLTTLSKMNTGLDDAVLEKLSRKHYTGWGNFSAKLIDGIRDKDSYKTILDYLKEDDLNNRNYMQLIHSPYLSFGKTIEEAKQINEIDDIVAVVQGLAGSPKNKKGIIQSIKVVKELVKVMGYEPDSIVIEWARENQTTKAGKKKSVSRYDKLKEPLEALAKQKKDSLLFVYGEYQKYSLRKLFSQNKEKSEHGKATEKYFFYSNLMNMFKDKITNAAGEEIELDVIERCPDTGLIAWDKEKDKKAVMKHFCSPQVNVVKKVEEQKVGLNGGLFDSNLKSTLFVSPDKLIPIKKGLDTRKYGGYQRLTTAYSVLLIQDNHDNILIPIYLIDKKEFEKFPETYLKEKGYLKENEYQIIKLPKYSLFDTGKGRRLLASSKQFQQANQLVVSKGSQDLLYFSSKFDKAEGKEYFKVNRAKGFDKLFEELIVFIDKNQIGSRLEELKELYKKNKDKASNEELAKNFVELLKYTKYGALDQKGIVFFGKQFPYTRYKSKKDLNSCINGVLIYQSITGLYETRVNLKKE